MARRSGRDSWDGPRPLNAGVERLMKHLRAPQTSTLQSIFDHWEDLVGDVIAAHSRPGKVVDGTLFIEVDDPAWASELTWLSADLLASIQERLKSSEINEISVKLAR